MGDRHYEAYVIVSGGLCGAPLGDECDLFWKACVGLLLETNVIVLEGLCGSSRKQM